MVHGHSRTLLGFTLVHSILLSVRFAIIRLYYYGLPDHALRETRDIRRDTPDRATGPEHSARLRAVHSHGPTPHATATLVPPLRDRTISRALYLSSLHCRDTVENEIHEKPPGPFS